MQAEEVQKELEEVKTKNAAAEQTSQSDAVVLRERLEAAEKERDDVTGMLGTADAEKNEAFRKVKELEQRSRELHERLVTTTEVSSVGDWLIDLMSGRSARVVNTQSCVAFFPLCVA